MRVCQQYRQALQAHDVTTIFVKGKASPEVAARVGGEVLFLDDQQGLRGIKFLVMWRLHQIVKGRSFDLVIGHRYKGIYFVGMLGYVHKFQCLLGVAHEHDVFKRITRALFVTFWRPQFYIAGVSDSVVANVLKYCQGKADRTLTLPNVVDSGLQYLGRAEARAALKISDEAEVVGTIGRLIDKKDHHTLINAFATLKRNTQLVLIGDGPNLDDLRHKVGLLGLTDRVIFTGHMPDAGQFVKAFDLFVLSSQHEEAFGVVLLEAMAAGVPVLSSDAPGPAQVLGDAGLLFNMGDAASLTHNMQTFFSLSPQAQEELGMAGAARANMTFGMAKFTSQLNGLPVFE